MHSMERRVKLSEWLIDCWMPSRQPARTRSAFHSIERNRPDEKYRFCLIRQLGSSLYFFDSAVLFKQLRS